MEATSSPQDVAGDPQVVVRVDPEEEDLDLWEGYGNHRTKKLTSLVLSTTTYQLSSPSSVLPISEDNHEDEVDNDKWSVAFVWFPLKQAIA